jgi:hypothetical protein
MGGGTLAFFESPILDALALSGIIIGFICLILLISLLIWIMAQR